ncbi:MAG: hypothetical protein ABIO88_05800 [Burkholderiaceae bacterium]
MGRPKTLLVLGHPGHELRIWQWLCQEKPTVCILTDGSGATGQSRLAVTDRTFERAGARFATHFSGVSDAQIYTAVLDQDLDFFVTVAAQIRDLLLAESFDIVVGDGSEGYNPTHDICRLLIDAAVQSAAHQGRHVLNYSFPLMGHPKGYRQAADDILVELTDEQLQQKTELITAYGAEAGGMLTTEIADTFDKFGQQAFKQERLFLTRLPQAEPQQVVEKPFYERHGEQRVAEGVYRYVIRYNEHIHPIHCRLMAWANEAVDSLQDDKTVSHA